MGCRCQERAASLARTVQAAKTGNTQTVAKELAFVATSTVQDAATIFRGKVAAARSRLSQRSPR